MLNNFFAQDFWKSDRLAYQTEKEMITYCELWKQVRCLAGALAQLPPGPVLVYGDKEIFEVVSILSCLLLHRPYVPLAPFLPLERIQEMKYLTGSTCLLSTTALPLGLPWINKIPSFEQDFVIETNEIAYIIFTSGSTGIPKGVPISRANLENFITWITGLKALQFEEPVRVLNQASFSFDLSVADFYYSFACGHTLCALSQEVQKDYSYLLKQVQKFQPQVAIMTPTFAKLLLLDASFSSVFLPTLSCLYFCGERLESVLVSKLWQRFSQLTVLNAYGPTEATSAVCCCQIKREMLSSELPVGEESSQATSSHIIDQEIVLSGPSVFSGYLGSNEFVKQYTTGDLGEWKEGYLYCFGRKDDQIKYRGFRIELEEIRTTIEQIEKVDSCVILPRKVDNQIVQLCAFIIGSICEEEVKCFLQKRLPYYMIPKIKIVSYFPLTENGKLNQKELLYD